MFQNCLVIFSQYNYSLKINHLAACLDRNWAIRMAFLAMLSLLVYFCLGMTVLDLGCGWGSVTLFVAKKFPKIEVFSLSNSATQREFIESEAKRQVPDRRDPITGHKNTGIRLPDIGIPDTSKY